MTLNGTKRYILYLVTVLGCIRVKFLDFRLSPLFEYCIFSSGYFPGVKL